MFGRGASFAGRVGSTLRGKFGRNQHKSALTAKRGNRLYQKGKNVPVEGKVNSRGACTPAAGCETGHVVLTPRAPLTLASLLSAPHPLALVVQVSLFRTRRSSSRSSCRQQRSSVMLLTTCVRLPPSRARHTASLSLSLSLSVLTVALRLPSHRAQLKPYVAPDAPLV